MLQERIKNNIDYFRGMEMTNGITVIKVAYKDRWGAYPTEDDSIKVAKSDTVANEWFYYADTDSVDIEKIFDLIEETVEMNSTVTFKLELLSEKINELKQLFSKTSLTKLQTLQFVMDENVKEKPKKRKYTKRKIKVTDNNDVDKIEEENE